MPRYESPDSFGTVSFLIQIVNNKQTLQTTCDSNLSFIENGSKQIITISFVSNVKLFTIKIGNYSMPEQK